MGLLSNNLSLPLLLTQWSGTLNPLLKSPIATPVLLSKISLTSGANTINHTLGTTLQGYIVVLNSAAATFYDSQSTNPSPARTLILNASADTVVSLLVF
jgi:hypothetical protein